MRETVLCADKVCLGYNDGTAWKKVLERFSLELKRGETVAVLGPAGIGKSWLLRTLAGLQSPASGSVTFGAQPLRDTHPEIALMLREAALVPWLTVEQNVGIGLDTVWRRNSRAGDNSQAIDSALAYLDLEAIRRQYPLALTEQEIHKTALARALARQPKVLLLDDPYGAMTPASRHNMRATLRKAAMDKQLALVLVTEEVDEALQLSDRILLLGDLPTWVMRRWAVKQHLRGARLRAELEDLRGDIVKAYRDSTRALRRAHARTRYLAHPPPEPLVVP